MLSWAAWGKITPTWSEKVLTHHKWRSSKRRGAHSSSHLCQFFKRMKKSLSIKVKQRNCDGLKLSRYIGKGGLRFRGSLIFPPPLSLSLSLSRFLSRFLTLSRTREIALISKKFIDESWFLIDAEKKKFRPPRWGRNFFEAGHPGPDRDRISKLTFFYSGGEGEHSSRVF